MASLRYRLFQLLSTKGKSTYGGLLLFPSTINNLYNLCHFLIFLQFSWLILLLVLWSSYNLSRVWFWFDFPERTFSEVPDQTMGPSSSFFFSIRLWFVLWAFSFLFLYLFLYYPCAGALTAQDWWPSYRYPRRVKLARDETPWFTHTQVRKLNLTFICTTGTQFSAWWPVPMLR